MREAAQWNISAEETLVNGPEPEGYDSWQDSTQSTEAQDLPSPAEEITAWGKLLPPEEKQQKQRPTAHETTATDERRILKRRRRTPDVQIWDGLRTKDSR